METNEKLISDDADMHIKKGNLVVHYKQISCKRLLHHFDKNFLPFNWGVNVYRGCEHSCVYCFARYTHEYLGYNSENDFGQNIIAKVNAPEVLKKELSEPKWNNEIINLGSVSDPYQPAEEKFGLTRKVLEILAHHKSRVIIGTKSDLILRDLDILKRIADNGFIHVDFSVMTTDDELQRKMEPYAPTIERRLKAIKKLTDASITVGVLFMPIFPHLNDDVKSINNVMSAIADAGANYVIPSVLNLMGTCKTRFMPFLQREFPYLVLKYQKLYRLPFATRDYTKEIYRTVEIARKKYSISRFEMEKSNEKQTKISMYCNG